MEVKTLAIVLRTVKYGDSRLIVDLFTRERGRVSFMCHASRSAKGRRQRQLFQPLTMLSVCYDERPAASLQRFRDLSLAHPYASLPFDGRKIAIAIFLAEFLRSALRDEREGGPMFDYIADSLLWLDAARDGFVNFHVVFLLRLTRFTGFWPNLDNWSEGAWFDMRDGAFTMTRPAHNDCLAPDQARLVVTLMRMDYANMRLFAISRPERNQIIDAALLYYRLHIPQFPELKSLDVLREMA